MQKPRTTIGVGILLLMMSISGCTQSTTEQEKFIGTWVTEPKQNPMSGTNYTETRTFYANGSYTTTNLGLGQIPGNWRLSNGNLIIDTYFPGTYQYRFSHNNTVLTLIADAGGFTENLTRQ
jgi:hypothetical protein